MAIALFYFHHLCNPKKVKSIRELARKLHLRGVYKRGFPGILFVSSRVEYVRVVWMSSGLGCRRHKSR